MMFYANKSSYQTLDVYRNAFSEIKDVKTVCLYQQNDFLQPFLSVIIPTYHRSKLLESAVESVLSQVQVNFCWELVIIENPDGSDRNESLEFVRKLNDPHIRYYRNSKNIGPGYNWNRGVELARGEWVTFLHDDDVLCPDALTNISRIIQKPMRLKKPLGYIQGRQVKFTDSFDADKVHKRDKPFCTLLTRTGTLITGRTRTGMPTCGTTILRKAYLESGGVHYDFGASADAVLGYRLMKDYTVILSDTVLGGYRIMENESQNMETIRALIESDDLFAAYRYARNWFSEVWGKIFGGTIHSLNVDTKLKSLLPKKLSSNDLEDLLKEKKTDPFLKLFYFGCVGIYLTGLLLVSYFRLS